MKVKNWFYLTVGVFSVVSAVTHTLHGLQTSLDVLANSGLDTNTKTVFTYVWHIIGIENLIIGIALVIMAFYKNIKLVKLTAWVFIIILIARWMVIFLSTLVFNNWNNVIEVITDSIAMLIVSILLIIGTQMKTKKEK